MMKLAATLLWLSLICIWRIDASKAEATRATVDGAPAGLEEDDRSIDFTGCFSDLAFVDHNSDGVIKADEYLRFIQEYAKRSCVSNDILTVEQATAFNTLACRCQSVVNATDDCCVGTNADIPIEAALDPQRTEAQLENLRDICRTTHETLPASQCATSDCTGGSTYSENGTQVLVYMEPLRGTASNLSNTKCVEFQDASNVTYSKACIDIEYDANGRVTVCQVAFDGTPCTSCQICETADDSIAPSFEINCNNTDLVSDNNAPEPCVPLDDGHVQKLLVPKGEFPTVDFVFDERECSERAAPSLPEIASPELNCTGGTIYSENEIEVLVYREPLEGTESNLSNSKCVEYITEKTGPGACFDTEYNASGFPTGCQATFDESPCSLCEICETPDQVQTVGFAIDCGDRVEANFETTGSNCIPLEDSNLQKLLVGEDEFVSVNFTFDEKECVEAPLTPRVPLAAEEDIIVFDISSGGIFTCVDVNSKCKYQTSDYSDINTDSGIVSPSEAGTTWAAEDPENDFFQVGECLVTDCLVSCNEGCYCVQPDRTFCETVNPVSSPGSLPPAPANQTDSHSANRTAAPTLAPSLAATLRPSSNIFSRPDGSTNSTISFPVSEYCSLFLKGMPEKLNTRQISKYVQAVKTFLNANGDETAVAFFISQQLLKILKTRRRRLEATGLEVRTQVKSWIDATPGTTTIDLILDNNERFVDWLKTQDNETFGAVYFVRADLIDEPSGPSPVVIPTKDDQSPDEGSEGESRLLLWCSIGILGASLICASAFAIHLHRWVRKEDSESSEEEEASREALDVDAYEDFIVNEETFD